MLSRPSQRLWRGASIASRSKVRLKPFPSRRPGSRLSQTWQHPHGPSLVHYQSNELDRPGVGRPCQPPSECFLGTFHKAVREAREQLHIMISNNPQFYTKEPTYKNANCICSWVGEHCFGLQSAMQSHQLSEGDDFWSVKCKTRNLRRISI